ncbi:MAG TPA: superoxide dismutase family protein [Methylomirabilota bacterium]|nr:superoxide dismutase family protein [Methylomirabilota bacterium]
MKALHRPTRAIGALGAALALIGALVLPTFAGGAVKASATIIDIGGAAIGWARFVEDATGTVHLSLHVKGLTPGLHGTHIHRVADCTPPFSAAGSHYNPGGALHGLDNPGGPHAGDLPNLVVNEDGVGHLDTTTDRVTLSAGPATLFDATTGQVGSALIIHARADDQITDPTGGSGGRIACGVIVAG